MGIVIFAIIVDGVIIVLNINMFSSSAKPK